MTAARALIIVDVQNDFCEGGSLAVAGGAAVAAAIGPHARRGDYDFVVASRDLHIDPGGHFSAEPDFVDTWPPHCVAGTPGPGFHPNLDVAQIQAVFDKGAYASAYSGFEGNEPGGARLHDWLVDHGVEALDVVGIATDHCVRLTALDAAVSGFKTRVLLNLCVGVTPKTTALALAQMREAGVALEP